MGRCWSPLTVRYSYSLQVNFVRQAWQNPDNGPKLGRIVSFWLLGQRNKFTDFLTFRNQRYLTKRSHCSHPSHIRLLSVLQKERNKDSLILESNTSWLNEIFETNLTSFLSQINENWAESFGYTKYAIENWRRGKTGNANFIACITKSNSCISSEAQTSVGNKRSCDNCLN